MEQVNMADNGSVHWGLKNKGINVYKLVISIVFGLSGFAINFYSINFAFPPYTATVLIGLLFPMLITLAWGWKYGLLSALVGGCQSVWWVWGPSNGYATFFVVPPFTLWIVWHGIFANLRRKEKEHKWWLGAYTAEIPFRILSTINLYTLARWAITLNPPSWDWAADALNTIPMEFSNFVVIKQAVVGYIILLLADVLLSLRSVRIFFRLKVDHDRAATSNIISASLLFGALFWLVDSVIGALVFFPDSSWLDLLVLDISPYQIFVRTAFILACLTGGMLASRLFSRQRESDRALQESEQRFKFLYSMVRMMCDNLPDLLWTKDLQGKFIFTNKACCEVLLNARDTDEPIGKTDLYFASREKESCPEDTDYHTLGDTCADSDLLVLETMKPQRFDEFGNVKGEFLFLDVYKTPFRDENGDVIGTVGCGRIVTKEKQIEKERQRAVAALQKRTEEIELLYQAGQQLGQTLDMDTIYSQLHGLVYGIMDCNTLTVSSFDPEDRLIRCTYAMIDGLIQDVNNVPTLPLNTAGRGTQSVAIQTGDSLLIRDYQEQIKSSQKAYYVNEEAKVTNHDKAPDDANVTRSGLVVPLKIEGQVVGIIQVGSYELDAYTGDDLRFLESLAQQIAVAGNNALLYRQAQDEIARRRQAEEERELLLAQISAQAEQMQQTIDTVPEGVLLLDAAQRVIRANPVAEQALATLAEVKVGDTLTHLGNCSLTDLLTSPLPQGLWHEVKMEGRTFEVIARPMENDPGSLVPGAEEQRPENWVFVIRDVTQEREIQWHLRQQERLAVVGQMAAGIAHDFNNIMSVIVLYTAMVLDENLSPRTHERLETISRQAQRATELIQQILDFSRRAVLELRPMDLVPFMKEVVKLLECTVPENIEIHLGYGKDEYTVSADPTRVQQVIMNLVVNARDVMPEGGELHIELDRLKIERNEEPPQPEMEAGEWVRVRVTDTGSGIPPDVLPHIFEPFFTTKAPGEGTGLGLAQVFGIVKQHKGHIGVSTRMEAGTTFTIYLPTLLEDQAELPAVEIQAFVKGQGETVLVVEDNAEMREAFADILELLNYKVLIAANGQSALGILEEYRQEIALVLSDLVMPVMGGKALFNALKRQYPEIKMIMLTGHPMERELQELKKEGLSGYLLKPPDIEKLAQLLARTLNKQD